MNITNKEKVDGEILNLDELKSKLEQDLENFDEKLKPLVKSFQKYLKHIDRIEETTREQRLKIDRNFKENEKYDKNGSPLFAYKLIKDSAERFSDGLSKLKEIVPLRIEVYRKIIEKFKKGLNVDIFIERFEPKEGFSEKENAPDYWSSDKFFTPLPSTSWENLRKEIQKIIF